MSFKKKRLVPLLTLILCTALALSMPLKVLAAEAALDCSGFDFADFFSAVTWDKTHADGSGNASIEGNVLSLSATGVGSGCGAQTSVTEVNLTAKETVSITYALADSAECSPPGEVTDNEGGTKTIIVPAGSSVTFSVEAGNGATTNNGTVTFHAVVAAESKIPADAASYSNGGKFYSYLDKAIAAAQAGSDKVIVVAKDGKVYHSSVETEENYTKSFTIPSGVTLLVPYNSSNTLITDDMDEAGHYTAKGATPAQELYRQLTMPSGTRITVNGAISVGSQATSQMKGQVGPYGAIVMDNGSNITINSGANLYAYGYIFYGKDGGGTVTVESGGTVYETAFIMDYPGSADNTQSLYNSGVFPMRAYSVRNVEVPMTFKSGATEYAFYSMYGTLIQTHPGYFSFLGNQSSNPFCLNTGATLTKSYSDGIQYITVNGNGELNPLNITLKVNVMGDFPVTSEKTAGFPLPSGFHITLNNGKLKLNDNFLMMEGSKLTIGGQAELDTNGKKIYVIDSEDDPGANSGSDVHGKSYTKVDKDAVLNVNGTLRVNGGSLYSSAKYGSITSSDGTGKVVFNGADVNDASAKIRYSSGANNKDLPMTSAYLQNIEGYTSTGNSTSNTYTYTAGYWRCDTHTDADNNHICEACGFASECTDTDDHNCDICGKEAISECEDLDNDVMCDICGAILCTHTEIVFVEAVLPDCTTEGTLEHYKCSVCELLFTDETGTTTITEKELADPATGHTPGDVVVENEVAPTCGKAGSYDNVTYCTVCTEEISRKTVPVEATGNHTEAAPVEENRKEPTCGEAGSYESVVKCADCGTEIRRETVPILATGEHTGAAAVKENESAATCTTDGSYDEVVYCSECDEELSRNTTTVPAKGHTNGEAVVENNVAPDCDTEGSYDNVVYCTVCDAEVSRDPVTVAALGHTNGEAVTENNTAATCGEAGSYDSVVYCTVCNEEISRKTETIPATGVHSYNGGVVTTDPSCTEKGVKTFTCSGCGVSYTEEVEATGHSYEAVVTAPTCESNGYTTYTCSCGDTYTDNATPATGHSMGDWIVDTNATCAQPGSKHKECANCNHTETEEIPVTGHTEVTDVAVAATCTTVGKTEGKHCSACGEVTVVQTEIPATGHTEVIDAAVAATCTTVGKTEGKHCSVCGEVTVVQTEIPATGHTEVIDAAVAATCTTVGKTEGKHCSVCGEVTVVQTEIPATGHTEVTDVAVAATCTTVGKTEGKHCSVCGEVTVAQTEVPATGHTEVTDAAVAPTCTTTGLTEGKHCSACGEVLVAQETVDVLGHSYSEAVTTAPTCGETGVKTFTCSGCGDSYTETMEATGSHSYGEGVVTKAPTTVDEGVMTYTCTVCGDTKTEAIDKLVGTVVSMDILSSDLANGPKITLKSGSTAGDGWNYEGSVTAGETVDFTVTYEKACVVIAAVTENGTTTYSRVPAAATDDANTYSFSAEAKENMVVYVAVKGDVNGDGAVNAADQSRLAYATLPPFNAMYDPLEGVSEKVADMTNDGSVNAADQSRLAYATLPPFNNMYDPFEW